MNLDTSYSYRVIERAIDILDQAAGPIDLASLAHSLNMSPSHFQKLFSKWVGVSPKAYQQYLTLGLSKKLLRQHRTTLETAECAGLSGTSRLYDLFLKWEAMTPGTYAAGGQGSDIYHGWYDSPFGPALVMATENGVCGLAFAQHDDHDATWQDMAARWPNANFQTKNQRLDDWATSIFHFSGTAKLALIGAPFHIKVWQALMQIETGSVTTYSDIARTIGHPKAVRAVGTAVGRNPIALLIPCHRALRKDGSLGGYHWGMAKKRAILAYESARRDANDAHESGKFLPF